jgi:hypothetical protein
MQGISVPSKSVIIERLHELCIYIYIYVYTLHVYLYVYMYICTIPCMSNFPYNNNNSSGYALAMWPSTSHLAACLIFLIYPACLFFLIYVSWGRFKNIQQALLGR